MIMKVIKQGYEKEVFCPNCKTTLLYAPQDVYHTSDLGNEWFYAVKCPECGKEIQIGI